MMKKNLLTNLPEDVFISNILLSKVLPIESLLSLRCVCKYLRNLIASHAFIKMQISKELNNNNNNPLVLIKATHRPNVFFSLKYNGGDPCRPEVVEFVSPIERPNICGSSNGLLCLTKGNDQDTVYLWNPVTKEYKVLPPPLPATDIPIAAIATKVYGKFVGSRTYGFGYDRLLDDYKIIRCCQHSVFGRFDDDCDNDIIIPITEFQVYTLKTNTWRNISTDNNPYMSYFVFSLPLSIVFVNGALHWIMSASNWWGHWGGEPSKRAETKIISFDIEKEVLREIQTPLMAKFKPGLDFCPDIQVLRGCLCVLELDSTETFSNVWMMMDYGVKGSWTKLFTILIKEVTGYRVLPPTGKLLRFCENGTEVLMESHNTILVYDPINSKARRVEFGEDFGKGMYQSEIYIESLVSLNSGVYKGDGRIQSKKRIRSKRRIR